MRHSVHVNVTHLFVVLSTLPGSPLLAASRQELARLRQRPTQRDAARREEFAAIAARQLPSLALERLQKARAAYEAGQGRLAKLLETSASEEALPEMREIRDRIEAASLREPISAGELKVKAPSLRAPALLASSGRGAAAGATSAPETDQGFSIGQVPSVLREAAANLEGPVEVFEWVRNNIRSEVYHGAMKGPVQAYLERSGNDSDTAGVLIQMLRAKGLPARYVRGTVQMTPDTLKAITGAATIEMAVRVLERAAVPHEVVPGGSGVAAVKLERVWAEVWVPYLDYRGVLLRPEGKVWIPLDPGFKRLEATRGFDVVEELGFSPRATLDAYLGGPQAASPLEFTRSRVGQLLAAQRPGTAYVDVLNGRVAFTESLGLLPNSLPYKVVTIADVGFDLPESLSHTLHVVAEAEDGVLIDHTAALADVLGRRLTVGWIPATEEDEEIARSFGGMTLTPPYLLEVRPVLRSSGIEVARGTGAVGMAVAYTLKVEFRTPGGLQTTTNRLLAGNLVAVGLGGRLVTGTEQGASQAAQILSTLAWAYLDSWNRADEELADLMRVIPVRPTVSACLVLSDIEVEYANGDPRYPLTFDWKGILIDADLRATAPVGVEGRERERDFLLLSGLEGSVLEHRVFEEVHQIPSVSTAKALGLAAVAGIVIHDLTAANVEAVLPTLGLDGLVQAEIREAVGRGNLVRVPAGSVTHLAWTGVGYLLLDETTGEAAWQLQGGHSGGVTAPDVIDIPESVRDPVARQGEDPNPEDSEVARISMFQSTNFQIGVVDRVLERPLKVLLTDADGSPVARAPVVFRVMGGGGEFVQEVGPGIFAPIGPVATLYSCDDGGAPSCPRGEAQVRFRLGRRTDLIPRYAQSAGEENATQVGVNLVMASSGAAALAEPFTAVGAPDDRWDGTRRYADLTNVSQQLNVNNDEGVNLAVAARMGVSTTDQHGNPLSNIPVQFVYKPTPVPRPAPPGWSRLRDGNTTPGHVLKPADYARCLADAPTVYYGECSGEAEAVTVSSSVFGAYAFAVTGDCPGCQYKYEIATGPGDVFPLTLSAEYGTWGYGCARPDPQACQPWGRLPWSVPFHGTRSAIGNRMGSLIEAYPPGGNGQVGLWADVLQEIERIDPTPRTDGAGTVYYLIEGSNRYRRRRLTDSTFTLSALTEGTSAAETAGHVGNGNYTAPMTMAAVPQLNRVRFQARHLRPDIPYLPGGASGAVREQDIDRDATPWQVIRRTDPSRPWQGQGTFSLWGARPVIQQIDRAPIFLREDSTVAHDVFVEHRIEPIEYSVLLERTQVRFNLLRGPDSVLAAHGAEATPYVIPAALPLQEGQYDAQMRILGVSLGAPPDLFSNVVPIEAGIVKLTVDCNNDTEVNDQDDAFSRSFPTRPFSFWENDPNLRDAVDTLVDYATVRINIPMPLGPGQTVALYLDGQWELRKKLATGKTYLLSGLGAGLQIASHVIPEQPRDPGEGTPGPLWMIPNTLLQSGDNEFLLKCITRADGQRACPGAQLVLQRVFGPNERPVIGEKRVDIRPFRELAGLVSVRRATTATNPGNPEDAHYRVAVAEQPAVGWKALIADPKVVTLVVHGFNVSDTEFKGEGDARGWLAGWAKRLYWVGHKILEVQDKAAIVGVSWPGNIPGGFDTGLYYPEDEFSALQAGVPVGKYIRFLRNRTTLQKLNIFAHSLGNMVVNNALKEIPSSGAPIDYVMNDAAIARDAFDQEYRPASVAPNNSGVRTLLGHARALGYPASESGTPDLIWQQHQTEVEDERRRANCPSGPAPLPDPPEPELCPPNLPEGVPIPLGCACRLVTSYFNRRASVNPVYGPFPPANTASTPFFTTRWGGIPRNQSDGTFASAWTGFFNSERNLSSALPGARIYNTFSRNDTVLNIDDGYIRWEPFDRAPSWLIAQMIGKPLGELSFLTAAAAIDLLRSDDGADDTVDEQRWWTLAIAGRPSGWRSTTDAGTEQNAIWGDAFPPSGTSRELRTRQWAQLALWFPAMAEPAGASVVVALGAARFSPPPIDVEGFTVDGRNINFTDIGGSEGSTPEGTPSHSYLQLRKFHEVWRGYRVIKALFAQ